MFLKLPLTILAVAVSTVTASPLDTLLGAESTETKRASFAHPGHLHTAADFTRITGYVNAMTNPWYIGWQKLVVHATPTYSPSPQATVYRGTGDWTNEFLATGIYGYQLANAGEILRGHSSWTGLSKLQYMMYKVFYTLNDYFLRNHKGAVMDRYWANWDLCNMATRQTIGVLSDNQTMFDQANTYFDNEAGTGAVEKVIWKLYTETGSGKSLGQGQEAECDQGHAILDFALLGVYASALSTSIVPLV